MLLVDGADDRVGIGSSTRIESATGVYFPLVVQANTNAHAIAIKGRAAADIGELSYYENDATTQVGNLQGRTGSMRLRSLTNDGNILFEANNNGGTLVDRLGLYPSEAVLNDDSQNTDFRVESDSKTHCLFVDAGTNAVGINSSSPGATKDFANTSVASNFHVDSDGFTNGPLFTYNGTGVFLALANDRGSGTRSYITFGDSASARYGDVSSNGSVMTYGGTSDHRLKTNVQAISGSIDRVKNLNPVTFDWISSGINAEGFIAHEVQSVVPDAATGTHNEVDSNGNPVYQQIDPRHIVPLLTGALKEAITKIETLEARITALENA